MAIKKIKLVSPDNTTIIGALHEDGSTFQVYLTYDTNAAFIDVILEHNPASDFLQKEGELIYIDTNGQKWPASTVEDHSILNSQT